MSVRFAVSGAQVRQLKAVLNFLGKIGPDLLVEALPQKLILRAINTSQSAYASVTLHSTFFDAYDVFNDSIVQTGVLIKHMLALFRTQRISKLAGQLDTESSKLVATVLSDSGLEKQYQVPCMDASILQANLERDAFPTCVIAAARELHRLLASFQNNLEEITIIATPDDDVANGPPSRAVQLHSFVDPYKGKAEQALQTQLAVDTHEVFLSYQHSADAACDVTFNLRDFKAMLTLCEALNADVAIRFGQPGSPLVVEPHLPAQAAQESVLAAELVLATLLETARVGDAGPATVARNAAGRLDTPGAGHVPGDTPWPRREPGVRQLDTGAVPAQPSRFAPQAAAGGAGAPFASGVFAEDARAGGGGAEPGPRHPRGSNPGGDPCRHPSSERLRGAPERRRRPPGLMDDAGDESEGEGASAEACGDDVHDPGAMVGPGPDPDPHSDAEVRAGTSGRAGGGADVAGSGFGQWDARGRTRFGQGGAGLQAAGQGVGGLEPAPRAGGGLAGLAGRLDEPGEDSEGGDMRAPPVASRYLAARMQDDDEDAPDGDAIPGTP